MPQSRREQLQAYRFMQRRVRTALLDADPDTNDAPLSRMGGATYAGIMIAILVLAAAGIYGIIDRGGSTAWKKPGTLIVERETSTKYIYVDKMLFQVLNVTSAKLILGDRMSILDVAHKSLSGTPHGGIIGIQGAPDYPPDPTKQMVGSTWSACVAGDLTASAAVPLQIQPGVDAAATGAPISTRDGILLRAGASTYLLWQSHVYLIPATWLTALRYGEAPPVNVSPDFIASIARGQTLQPLTVAGAGRPGPVLANGFRTKVGQVLQDTRNAAIFYLVVPGGVAYLKPLPAALQLASRGTQRLDGRPGAIRVDSGTALTRVHIAAQPPGSAPAAQQPPPTTPALIAPAPDHQICAVFPPKQAATVVYGRSIPVPSTAGLVRLALGDGAVVQAIAPPGTVDPALYFVSDTSQKFPIKADALALLGLSAAPVAHVSAAVLETIPSGPALTQAAASLVIGGGKVHPPK